MKLRLAAGMVALSMGLVGGSVWAEEPVMIGLI